MTDCGTPPVIAHELFNYDLTTYAREAISWCEQGFTFGNKMTKLWTCNVTLDDEGLVYPMWEAQTNESCQGIDDFVHGAKVGF